MKAAPERTGWVPRPAGTCSGLVAAGIAATLIAVAILSPLSGVTTTPASASGPATSSAPASASAPAADANVIRRLIALLDDDDWRTRDRAGEELMRIGRPAEEDLKAAMERPGASAEVKLRAGELYSRIASWRLDIKGVWEVQLWGNITYLDLVRISVGPDGKIKMDCPPDAPHPHYVFSKPVREGNTFTYHELANPGYEFDMVLKVISPTELSGTRTRQSDGAHWPFKILKVRELDGTKIPRPAAPEQK